MIKKTLVIGGTGKVGAHLVDGLIEHSIPVRSASRSGQAPAGAEGVKFDWFDRGSHEAVLSDVDRVFMIAPIGATDPLESMEPFINRALDAGVARFVLLSSSLIEEGGPAMGAVHALLRRHAPDWAVLRPSWFAENFTIDPHLSSIRFEDTIYSATGEGVVPFITARDIAEVARAVLDRTAAINDGLILTGPTLLSYADVAGIIGAARGKPIQHKQLTGEALAARLEGFGLPIEFAQMLANLDGAIAAGAEGRTTGLVRDLTGRDPVSLDRFVQSQPTLWQAPQA